MRIYEPDYAGGFRCLAGACPHSCCEKWEVVVDEESVRRYQALPGPLGERLRGALELDEEGAWCFPLRGGRCPFLDGENLCEIHRHLGEAATSETCRAHPRFVEDYGPFRELTLSASCPAANALLLGSEGPLTFPLRRSGEPGQAGDPWLPFLLPLRSRLLEILADRSRPLKARLGDFLRLALAAQSFLDAERESELPALAAAWREEAAPAAAPGPGLFPAALDILAGLEVLEPDWPELLERGKDAPSGQTPEPLLERTAVYFAFGHLLKAVNDGDLLGQAELCVLLTLTAERLAPLCGLGEALRRLSCEIEHSQENLDALALAFGTEAALSPAAFFRALGA